MGRMYSGAKGRSGSKRPLENKVPTWVSYKPAEVEALVAKYAKERLTPAQIGLKLRDSYGIPSVKVLTKKTIVQILSEKKLVKAIPQDLIDVIAKYVALQKHIEQNKVDKNAGRGLTLTYSKINRLIKYYKKTEKLAADWKFDSSKAGMYLE